VKFERKHAVVLLVIAVWNVLTWSRFIKALIDTNNKPTGYYVAHAGLIIVNFIIAAVLGTWGWQALRASRASSPTGPD
jgi:hypothetical protein